MEEKVLQDDKNSTHDPHKKGYEKDLSPGKFHSATQEVVVHPNVS